MYKNTHKYITLIHTYHIHIYTATHIIRTETHIGNTGIHTEHIDTQRYITYLNTHGHTHPDISIDFQTLKYIKITGWLLT